MRESRYNPLALYLYLVGTHGKLKWVRTQGSQSAQPPPHLGSGRHQLAHGPHIAVHPAPPVGSSINTVTSKPWLECTHVKPCSHPLYQKQRKKKRWDGSFSALSLSMWTRSTLPEWKEKMGQQTRLLSPFRVSGLLMGSSCCLAGFVFWSACILDRWP